jgi:hypothetical protein
MLFVRVEAKEAYKFIFRARIIWGESGSAT